MNRSKFFLKIFISLVFLALAFLAVKVYDRPSVEMLRSPQLVIGQSPWTDHLAELDANKLVDNDSLLLVDLRPSHEFRQGHLHGAMNVPLSILGKKVARDKITRAQATGRQLILYASDLQDSEGAWILLYQMGIDGLKVLPVNLKARGNQLEILEQKVNAANMDYASNFNQATRQKQAPKTPMPQKKVIKPIRKPKKRAPEGGC